MEKLNKKTLILDQASNIFIIVLFVTVTVIIVSLKIGLLSNWLYSSDLFTYDTILQEALKGNLGLEYTYGNSLGDHAYLGLFLLVPLKLILKGKMVYFLVLITPLLFFSACIALYYFVSKRRFLWFEKFLVFIPLIFLLDIIKGNAEGIYGFHPDTGMGFLLFIIALLLETLKNKDGQTRIKTLIWILVLIFVLTKEEMALLAMVFFGILLLLERKKEHFIFFLLSLAIFVVGMFLIKESKTILNRGNNVILSHFVNAANEQGFLSVLKDVPFNKFWNYLIVYVGAFSILLFLKKPKNIAIAIFTVGLAKAMLCFLIADYSFDTWHSFPALAMFIGAIIIQYTGENRKMRGAQFSRLALVILSIISIQNFRHDWVYRNSGRGCMHATKHYKMQVKDDITELKKYVDKNKVVALNTYLTINFTDGYRYAFYPRGVDWPPAQIASYIIVDKTTTSMKHLVQSSTESLTEAGKNGYHKIFENNGFILLGRDKPLNADEGDCKVIVEKYGRESLGLN